MHQQEVTSLWHLLVLVVVLVLVLLVLQALPPVLVSVRQQV
jgi:hypothetical protein